MKKIARYLSKTAITAVIILSAGAFAYGGESNPRPGKLIVFHSTMCHSCFDVERDVLPDIEKKFSNMLAIERRDISGIENYKMLLGLQESRGIEPNGNLPVLYCEGLFLSGEAAIKRDYLAFIDKALAAKKAPAAPALPSIDIISRFKEFRPLAVAGAGLVDGVNPCAFTVIVFFSSFLALQGYRKREIIIIGTIFLFSVFTAYLLMGVGLLNFLYGFKSFHIVSRVINLSIGTFSVLLGLAAIYDYFKFRKTGKADGLILQLPSAIKNRIHSIIGQNYRKERDGLPSGHRSIAALGVTSFMTGFSVSILEAACTGQVYLPTISFVLKTSSLKMQAFEYLALYNLMFIVPLLIIFAFALIGVTWQQFSHFITRRMGTVKILMAAIFFGFGYLLISGA